MKLLLAFIIIMMANITYSRTVVIDVHGMTCAFCVDSLERKFSTIDTISKVEVSLKNNQIRLETQSTEPSIEKIKQAVLDAGFTPISVNISNSSPE